MMNALDLYDGPSVNLYYLGSMSELFTTLPVCPYKIMDGLFYLKPLVKGQRRKEAKSKISLESHVVPCLES